VLLAGLVSKTGSELDQLLQRANLQLGHALRFRSPRPVRPRASIVRTIIASDVPTQLPRAAAELAIVVAIPRGRPGPVSLHGATFVALEAIKLSLAAAKPEAALASLDKLHRLRRATKVQSKLQR